MMIAKRGSTPKYSIIIIIIAFHIFQNTWHLVILCSCFRQDDIIAVVHNIPGKNPGQWVFKHTSPRSLRLTTISE